jgi:hypothetical protein
MNRFLAAAAALAAVLLGGCNGGAPGAAAAPKMEVRVYAVPPEQTDALRETFNKVFSTSENAAIGKASSPAPGQLLVLAPANLQGSIEASIRSLTANRPPAAEKAPGRQMRLAFWSVDAIPENGRDDLELDSLQGALEEARKQLGPVRFVLRDEIGAVSSPGQQVERRWLGAKLTNESGRPQRQLAYTLEDRGGGLMLNLHVVEQVPVMIARDGQNVVEYLDIGADTTTAIRPGQTLVITRNPIPKDAVSTGEPTVSNRTTRLYLVRVDELPAA